MLYVAALIAGYFAALTVLSIIARPQRVRLVRLANELRADYPRNELICELCEHYVTTAYSLRVAPIRLHVYMASLFRPGRDIDKECERMVRDNPDFVRDVRVGQLMEAYNASTTAVSPVFGMLANLARVAFIAKSYIHHRGKADRQTYTELVEMRAAT